MDPIALVFIIVIGWIGGMQYEETQTKNHCDDFKSVRLHSDIYVCKKQN